MGSADLLSYAQLILATIGIIAILHRFLLPDHSGVTEITLSQPPVEDEVINIQRAESMYRHILATDDRPRKKLQCSDYSVGIITALPNEMKAAISVLDEEHGPPSDFCKPPGDYNHYVWGSMSTRSEAAHNVVIASFPAKRPGAVAAADVARLMVTTFPSIRLGLMVGIGGGVPSPNDIRLGDVVVSQGSGTTAGVVQYDFGKEEEEGFRRQGQMDSPPAALLSAMTAFEARDPESNLIKAVTRASSKIQDTCLNLKNEPTYTYQGEENDRLFQSHYHGPGTAQWPIVSSLFRMLQLSQPTHKNCASCDPRMLVERDSRSLPGIPRIHYGLIASGNRVIKSARTRDKIVASLKQDTNSGDCLCFEMEAAGLMNNFPCLVIRGVSDYADAHKNDVWHNYAALTAAAYARELLRVLSTAEVSSSKPAGEIIGQIRRDVRTIKAELRKISDEQIQDWLEPSNQQTNLDQAQHEIGRYQTESTWLFEQEDYRDWISHKIHHIWLHGPSGCGKTVLASTVVKQLLEGEKLCLYFFFDFRDAGKQSLESLLRSLIWQIFSRSDSESVKNLVRQLYEDRESPTSTIEKLKDTFDKMMEEVDEAQVVLDALDESTRKRTDRDELLRWLKLRAQYEEPGVCKFRTIITSRSDQQDILNILGPSCVGIREICIENKSAKVKANIHQYIQIRLSTDGGFAEWREPPNTRFALEDKLQEQEEMKKWHPIMREMEQCLVDKAGLMFRWASLTINSLGEMGTIQKIKEALESLPDGLDEIYTRSLDEIKHHKSDAIRILQLLLFSPIQLEEKYILDATSVDLEAPPGCGINPNMRLNSLDKLSSLMSTFIRRRKYSRGVEIAHSSVRDYLIYVSPGIPPKYKFREVSAKAAVVGVCLGYMDSILTNSIYPDLELRKDVFLHSADCIWTILACDEEHLNERRTIPSWSYDRSIFSLRTSRGLSKVALLIHDSSVQERSVQEEAYNFILKFLIHNGSKLQQRTSRYLSEMYGGPPLYVASAIGLTRIVAKLLSAGVRADEKAGIDGFAAAIALPKSFYKNALDCFAVKEHEEIKYEHGWDIRCKDALIAACYHGHDSIVQMLLNSKVDANGDEGTSYGIPLYAACQSENPKVVKILLDKGAKVDIRNFLHTACRLQNIEIVKLLLDKGADINIGIGNPLCTACRSGNLELVKLLLDRGADVNSQEGHRGNALSIACSCGNEGIVSVLLENGADANAGGGDLGHPLQAAACSLKRELVAMVELLLERGAYVNAKGGVHGTALHAAVKSSHNRIINLLLNAGADIHIDAGKCGTIMEAACFSKSEETLRLLLKAGINPNSPSPGRGRILQLAAFEEQPYIVRYLLETGVDLADLDGLTHWDRKFIFGVARKYCNEAVLERLEIRKS